MAARIIRKNTKRLLLLVGLFLMLLIVPASAKRGSKSVNKSGSNRSRRSSAPSTARRKMSRQRRSVNKTRRHKLKTKKRIAIRSQSLQQFRKTEHLSSATRTTEPALFANNNLQQPRTEVSLRSETETTRPALSSSNFTGTSFSSQNYTWQNRRADRTEHSIRQWRNSPGINTSHHRTRRLLCKPRNTINRPRHRGFTRRHHRRWPRFGHHHFYPHHRRSSIFIYFGGYWPSSYSYYRYHGFPYSWYGYYPYTYSLYPRTYYYVYNYNDENYSTGLAPSYIRPADENTFADVRERLAENAAQTTADKYFEDAVKAFEAGDYDIASAKLAEAINLEPDDIALPFAYVQALFADRQFTKAAEVLREAIDKLPTDSEGLFYPRGLYSDDGDILFEQIGRLAEKAELCPLDDDLQLLLGYQFLGAGKLDRAEQYLQKIALTSQNSDAAKKMLEVIEKIRTEPPQDSNYFSEN